MSWFCPWIGPHAYLFACLDNKKGLQKILFKSYYHMFLFLKAPISRNWFEKYILVRFSENSCLNFFYSKNQNEQ